MRIAIIGGGAAGLMAAAAVHETDPRAEVFLIEKNDGLGKKVLISGGGRCNLTTGIRDIRMVLTKYPRGAKFLTKAMHRFPPEVVAAWFEGHGVPLKVEADQRVFPVSNDGRDVVAALTAAFGGAAVKTMLKTQVMAVRKNRDGFAVSLKNQDAPLLVDRVVLTTGGQAYRQTGSTGDGYGFAVSLGHSLTPLAPSLSALATADKWVADLAGVSFKKALLRAGERKAEGPFIFTHRGLSGPAVFALSSLVAFDDFSPAKPLAVSIDFFPDRKLADLSEMALFHLQKYPKKSLANVLGALVPKSFSAIVCGQCGLDAESPAAGCGKKCAENLAKCLKDFRLNVVGRSAGEEFVTAGGIDLKEVDPSTMQSKICPGLFLAGEILDIDGFTGGFNLQSAWATGRLAGQSAAFGSGAAR